MTHFAVEDQRSLEEMKLNEPGRQKLGTLFEALSAGAAASPGKAIF